MDIKCNPNEMFDIDVIISSVPFALTIEQMYEIKNYVRACEIAEYIFDNYKIESTERAIELGIEIRDLIYDQEIREDEAICRVLEQYGYLEI